MTADARTSCEFRSQDLILELEMNLAAEVEAIGSVVEEVMGKVREMGCAAGKEYEVELSLREALANAVLHGARGDPNKQVQISVACDTSRGMLIVVRDPGEGFDPEKLPSPLAGQQVFSTHGRGIYLINRLMHQVRIERGGTEIHMLKS